jgi:HK97 family phage major capsid protein
VTEEKKFSRDELRSHIAEVKERISVLATEFEGREFSEDARLEFEALKDERAKSEGLLKDLEERAAYVDTLAQNDANTEPERKYEFQVGNRKRVPDDPTDLAGYRTMARNIDEVDDAYRDGAKYLIENRYKPAHPGSREDAQKDAERLTDLDREVALRFILTSRKEYRSEFKQYVQHGAIGPEMMRAASLTTTAGGYAVPVELDTTLLLTNAGAINPIRQLARVRQTNVNTVEFLNTTGITAAFNNEATEASDNAPTLAQPTVNIEKAFAFVPASIEIFQDWDGIQSDMAMAFADAKNRLESAKFLTGLGHASHEPQGLIAAGGATAVISSATTAVFAVADLFSLEIALSARYRANAAFVGNRAAYQKVRQFASNGVNIWEQLPGANPSQLLGYPAHEWSDYAATLTTSGSTILTLGDFSYFAIVDRAGASVEYIPHVFGGSNRFPTGQRGLYYWWRTSSQVLSPTLQANSAFVSLKLL